MSPSSSDDRHFNRGGSCECFNYRKGRQAVEDAPRWDWGAHSRKTISNSRSSRKMPVAVLFSRATRNEFVVATDDRFGVPTRISCNSSIRNVVRAKCCELENRFSGGWETEIYLFGPRNGRNVSLHRSRSLSVEFYFRSSQCHRAQRTITCIYCTGDWMKSILIYMWRLVCTGVFFAFYY